MELIVEAVLTGGFHDEDAMGEFLDRVDLNGAQAELFFAEWENDSHRLTCVFQTGTRWQRTAIRRASKVVNEALHSLDRQDLIAAFQYTVRPAETEDEDSTTWKDTLVANLAMLILPMACVDAAKGRGGDSAAGVRGNLAWSALS